MDPLSLALLAASAFAKYQANEEAAEQREAYRQRMEAYQRTRAKATERATDDLLKKQTPEERETELKAITTDREGSLRDTVGAAQAFDAPQIAGKLSGDYRATQEASAARIAERTRRAIEQLATMGAPQEQAHEFNRRFGRAAGEVDANNRASENVGRGYMQDISNVQPDPFLSLAGDVGMAVAGSGAFEGATPPVETPGPGDPEWGLMDPGRSASSQGLKAVRGKLKAGLDNLRGVLG